jgi:NAD(P)-dependent dehydrogenase (short-subunit alcohol dehydrogenase family)
MKLRGSVVILTGASSGIGAATARELARHGAKVVLAARRGDELRALQAAIADAGGEALAVPADVCQRSDIDRLVATAVEKYGRVDVLINNAGISAGSSIADSSDETLQRIVDVNLLAPARCIQSVLPHMRRQGQGLIVNVGSVAGEVATSGLYAATKFGLRGLSDAFRRELRRDGIGVVLIVPGFIRTPMTVGVKVPMPGPEAVARAIAGAIQRPRRRIVVPWPYLPLAYIAKALPWLVDILLGSRAFQNHARERPRTS